MARSPGLAPGRGATGFWLAMVMPASAAPDDAVQTQTQSPVLEIFGPEGCRLCENAKEFLVRLQRERPWLRIEFQAVDREPRAAEGRASRFAAARV